MKLAPALQARLWFLASRTGAVGAAGAACTAAALALVLIAHLQLAPANRANAAELDPLRAQIAKASAPGAALIDPADAVAAVTGELPPPDRIAAFIEDVQADAVHGGVQIDRTEYRMQSALEKRALRLQLVLPAHGSYPQLRAWLQKLLQAYPTAALDELSLRRQAQGAAQLEAHVVFSFYTQALR